MDRLKILKTCMETNKKYILLLALVLCQVQVYLLLTRPGIIYERETQFMKRFEKINQII